jgi:hypothetical protein
MSPAVDTSKGRFYPWKESKYVSVTTAISEGIPKPQLNRWFVRSMAEVAATNRGDLALLSEERAKEWLMAYRSPRDGTAAILGSSIHSMIERIIKGLPCREPSAEEAPYIKAFMAFVNKRKPKFIESEATVFSREHGYAGTMDAMMEIDGNVYVVDTKTGKGVWPEAALQLAAYRHADFFGRPDGTEDPIPTCSGGLVLHLRPQGHQVVPVDTGPEVFDTFLSALDVFRWVNIDSAHVIGHKWK